MNQFITPELEVQANGTSLIKDYNYYYSNVLEMLSTPAFTCVVIQNDKDATEMRKTRATLNKMKKMVDDFRKDTKKDFMNTFEAQCNSIYDLIDSRQKEFANNIKEYEDSLKSVVADVNNKPKKCVATISYYDNTEFERELVELCKKYNAEMKVK